MIKSQTNMSGMLNAKKISPPKAPLSWRIKNVLRWNFILGFLAYYTAKGFTKLTGIPTITSRLMGRLIRDDGSTVDYGILGYRVVTTAGVGFLVDDWDDDTTDITTMNFHASGTDNTAEDTSDTALGTESTGVTDRATGTKTQPSANVLQSVGTQTFTGSAAIVEHGILSSATEGAGVLWDRTVFSAINVASSDQIQFTYQCTVNAGG